MSGEHKRPLRPMKRQKAIDGVFLEPQYSNPRSLGSSERTVTKIPQPIKEQRTITSIDSPSPPASESKIISVSPFEKTDAPAPTSRRRQFGRIGIYAVLIGGIFIGGYISYDTWKTNQAVKVQTAHADSSSQAEEGKDESVPKKSAIDSYAVSAELPRTISIPQLGVSARVLQMGVKADNQLQAPQNINDTGWYTGSSKPGYPGAVLIDGHVSGPTKPGIFKNLKNLKNGDQISLDTGSKQVFHYKVMAVKTQKADQINMITLLQPYDTASKGLNLITCGGSFNKNTNAYESRTLVYAQQVD